MAKRPRAKFDVPRNDAAAILGGEETLARHLGEETRSRKSSKSRKAKVVPIQDIGAQIYLAWKNGLGVDLDAVRKQAFREGYDKAIADSVALEEAKLEGLRRLRPG